MKNIPIIALCLLGSLSNIACSKNEPDAPVPHDKAPKSNAGLSIVPAGQAATSQANKSVLKIASDELRVILVNPNGPAAKAGFHAGDVLLAGDGTDINNEDDLAHVLKRAARKKVFFEVRSEDKLLTLPMNTSDPGWLVLSGDMFKGFLLNRIQSKKKNEKPTSGKAHPLDFPSYDGKKLNTEAMLGHPVAILFWGTFRSDSYEHLGAFAKSCKHLADKGLQCVSVNTLELFTMVKKTKQYAKELARVRSEIYPAGPILVDMFMKSEYLFGIEKVPSLLLLDSNGNIVKRHDGPLANPMQEMEPFLSSVTAQSR